MKYIVILCFSFLTGAWIFDKNTMISSIYGNIEPVGAASKVLAIKGTDTVAVVPQSGKFSIAVSTGGVWKLYVQAISPYKDATVNNIKVEDGRSTDAGIIKLVSAH